VAAISKTVEDITSYIRTGLRSKFGARLVTLFLAVAPVPASRPRVTRFGGVYYGAPYKRFYEAAKTALSKMDFPTTGAPVIWMGEFVIPKPRTGKLDYPRGDVDNYSKGPLDAMTKAAERFWQDDNQVVGMIAFKRYADPGEEPGVKIDYAPLELT
jgi:Holliday junction resolvase RusA-like endonuclease